MHVYPTGPDHTLVVYLTRDDPATARQGRTTTFVEQVAEDAAKRAQDGVRIVASDTLETAGFGTSGGMSLDTGDEHPLDLAVQTVYVR